MDRSSSSTSLFRSNAWVSAWLETWGRDPRIQLFDIGGAANPLDFVYILSHRIKNILPVKSLVSAGYGYAQFDPPRAEYNTLDSLIQRFGGISALTKELKKYSWDQWVIPDMLVDPDASATVETIKAQGLYQVKTKSEPSYKIEPIDAVQYKKNLPASVRAKYFNRRSRLLECGEMELADASTRDEFFFYLNSFHQKRWHKPCYSDMSMRFFSMFIDRLPDEGGTAKLQIMKLDGEVISVLFDVIWNGYRYNLQSGYLENRFGNVALGALHLGFAIENALEVGLGYNFLAGRGRNTNYKEKIATSTDLLQTCCFSRYWLKYFYKAYGK